MTGGCAGAGGGCAASSAVWFLLLNGWLMPRLAPPGFTTMVAAKITPLGSDWRDAARRLGAAPWVLAGNLLGRMFAGGSAVYLARIFVPFAPLLVFARKRDLFSLGAAVLLASLNLLINPEHELVSHYQLILTPFLFYFALRTLPLLVRRVGLGRATVLLLLCSFVTYDGAPVMLVRGFRTLAGQERLTEALSRIPSEASVSSQNSLLPHLSLRKTARVFSTPQALQEDYVLLSTLPGLSLSGPRRVGSEHGAHRVPALPSALRYGRHAALVPGRHLWPVNSISFGTPSPESAVSSSVTVADSKARS